MWCFPCSAYRDIANADDRKVEGLRFEQTIVKHQISDAYHQPIEP